MCDFTLDQYNRSKESVSQAARQLIALAQERADLELSRRVQSQIEKLEAARFNLAVVGEFKRGKSTFVNALIHEQLLPMAVIPLTSVTTIIAHGQSRSIEVIFASGKIEKIAAGELKEYVTEGENPANYKMVSRVQIEHPSNFLQDGVCIIDTPGVGSAYEHNTQTTYDYLPQIDAAIFLFSADQPASLVELSFLQDVLTCTAKVFLVQNKIDYLAESELQESLEYLSQTIEEKLGAKFTIYPISAKFALLERTGKAFENLSGSGHGSGLINLEDAIMQYLLNGKARTLISTTSNRLLKEIAAARQLILLEQHSRSIPQDKLRQSIAAFTFAGERIMQSQSDTEFIMAGETAKLLQEIDIHLKLFVETEKTKLLAHMDDCFLENQRLGKGELIKIMHRQLLEYLQNIFNQWRIVEEQKVAKSFEKITARFADESNLIIAQTGQASLEHLGVEVAIRFELAPLTNDSQHRYAVDDPFTMALESLPLLLPAPLARPIIRSRFLQAADNEIGRNAGRLRSDFQERVEKTTKAFLSKFKGQILLSLAEISTILSRVAEQEKQNSEELAASQTNLTRQLKTLALAEVKLAQFSA